jgi:hypothetical protein
MKRVAAGLVVAAVIALGAPSLARADIVAVYLGGYGSLASHPSGDPGSGSTSLTPGVGFELGARLLIFDAYVDRAQFFDGRGVTRGIVGLRVGFGISDLRVALRTGVGPVFEQGGALTGAPTDTRDRHGLVARAGISVEKRLSPNVFAIGLAVDGEYFTLDSAIGEWSSLRSQGSDVLASLRLKFELGI